METSRIPGRQGFLVKGTFETEHATCEKTECTACSLTGLIVRARLTGFKIVVVARGIFRTPKIEISAGLK